ncbi:MAG: RNA polymerase sigma factor [Acidimicrobiales bacterium]
MERSTEQASADGWLAERETVALVRVEHAAIARYGAEIGAEVISEVRAWAWDHVDEVVAADNPAGLLYRVAQSNARRHLRWAKRRAPVELLPEQVVRDRNAELVDLFRSLGALSEAQRVAVVLVHAHGERYDDVARLLGVSTAAVTNHVHRGLKKLRHLMEVDHD